MLKRIDSKVEQVTLLQDILEARPPRLIADKIQFDLDSTIKGIQGKKEHGKIAVSYSDMTRAHKNPHIIAFSQ